MFLQAPSEIYLGRGLLTVFPPNDSIWLCYRIDFLIFSISILIDKRKACHKYCQYNAYIGIILRFTNFFKSFQQKI